MPILRFRGFATSKNGAFRNSAFFAKIKIANRGPPAGPRGKVGQTLFAPNLFLLGPRGFPEESSVAAGTGPGWPAAGWAGRPLNPCQPWSQNGAVEKGYVFKFESFSHTLVFAVSQVVL